MSIWTYRGRSRENELSLFGKSALLVAWIAFGATVNIARGEVRHPATFFVVLLGFVLFAVAKCSVIYRKKRLSFGTSHMTEK